MHGNAYCVKDESAVGSGTVILLERCPRTWFVIVLAIILIGSQAAIAASTYQLYGLDFSPYLAGQAPPAQISAAQIQSRLAIIARYTKWVRTYSSLNGLDQICPIAHQMGLKCAAGASIYGSSVDGQEISSLISLAQSGYVDLAIVGTEALFRGNVSAQTLISEINQVKAAAPSVPVTTADTYGALLNNSNVLSAVDVVLFNIYPFYEGISLDQSVSYINGWYQLMTQAAPGKQVIISETGWPSAGGSIGAAAASPVNAASYFLNFVSWCRANSVGCFYFEAFDEAWKIIENSQGPNFGIFDQSGTLKPGMNAVLAGNTIPDNWSGNAVPGGPGTPAVILTYVPVFGNTANLYGRVSHVRPADYKIGCYIYVSGVWYVKPYAAQPLTPIFSDGTWRCSPASTGDTTETSIAALLVPNGASLPWRIIDGSPPAALMATVQPVASAVVNRTMYGIAGTIQDAQGVGIDNVTVSLFGSPSETAQTTNGGQYSFVDLNAGGTYTVTPAATSAVFSPASQTISNLNSVQSANFAATSHLLQISGQISDAAGNAFRGLSVVINGTANASVLTDTFGNYLFDKLLPNGSYTVTPSSGSTLFTPPSLTYPNLVTNQMGAFTASTLVTSPRMAQFAVWRPANAY